MAAANCVPLIARITTNGEYGFSMLHHYDSPADSGIFGQRRSCYEGYSNAYSAAAAGMFYAPRF